MKYLFLSLLCVGCAAFGSLAAEDVKPAADVKDCATACDDAKVDCTVANADGAACTVKATKVADACCPTETAKAEKVACTVDAAKACPIDGEKKVAVAEAATEVAK